MAVKNTSERNFIIILEKVSKQNIQSFLELKTSSPDLYRSLMNSLGCFSETILRSIRMPPKLSAETCYKYLCVHLFHHPYELDAIIRAPSECRARLWVDYCKRCVRELYIKQV